MAKKLKKERKFLIWEQAGITAAMIDAANLKYGIELAAEQSTNGKLKPALVPIDVLYGIVSSHLAMYEALLTEDLIKSGNINKLPLTIH